MEQGKDDQRTGAIDRDVINLQCPMSEIEDAVRHLKRRLEHTNQVYGRLEREADARVAAQKAAEEARRLEVLQAVKNIRFDEP